MAEEIENTSGQGKDAIVPDAVAKRFNWGAFFFSWIWGIFNYSFMTFVMFGIYVLAFINIIISIVSGVLIFAVGLNMLLYIIQIALKIWFGVKGNSWAWQNKKWQSIEKFHRIQKDWATVAGIILTVGLASTILSIMLPTMHLLHLQKVNKLIEKHQSVVSKVVNINNANGVICDKTTDGLTSCFARRLQVIKRTDNMLELKDGAKYYFQGDGKCKEDNSCYIVVYPLAKEERYKIEIGLKARKYGILEVVENKQDKSKSKY